jgi:hypothetical protein
MRLAKSRRKGLENSVHRLFETMPRANHYTVRLRLLRVVWAAPAFCDAPAPEIARCAAKSRPSKTQNFGHFYHH